MIQLREAGSHLSASRSRCGDDNQRFGSLNVVVLSITLIAYDVGNVVRVSVNRIMAVYFDAKMFKLRLKDICGWLPGVASDDHAAYVQALVTVFLDETQNVGIVSDAKVVANLVFFNVSRVDGDDDFGLIGQLQKHFQLTVWCEARQNAGSMVVVKQLTAELQVQLVSELADPLADVFGLHR